MKPHYKPLTDFMVHLIKKGVLHTSPVIANDKRVYITPNSYLDHVDGFLIYGYTSYLKFVRDNSLSDFTDNMVTVNPVNLEYKELYYKHDPEAKLYKELIKPYEDDISECYLRLANYNYFLAWSETVHMTNVDIKLTGKNFFLFINAHANYDIFLYLKDLLLLTARRSQVFTTTFDEAVGLYVVDMVTKEHLPLKWLVHEKALWFIEPMRCHADLVSTVPSKRRKPKGFSNVINRIRGI